MVVYLSSRVLALPAVLAASILLASAWAAPARAATLRVPTDYPTIQEAIDAASSGDTVLVAPGDYFESVDFGFKEIFLRSTAGSSRTAIVGQGRRTPQYAVRMRFGELSGFTIRNQARSPKGVRVSNVGARIVDNVFDGSDEPIGTSGEAITVFVGAPIIERNLFVGHACDDQFSSSVVALVNRSPARLANNVWLRNDCPALRLGGSSFVGLVVVNNTMVDNRVGIKAIAPLAGAEFANNLLVNGEVGVIFPPGQPFQWRHNLVFGFTTAYDGPYDPTGTDGNLNDDPRLTDLGGGHLRLASGSPAVDAALDALAPLEDFAGRTRPVDGDFDGLAVSDIGAFERHPEAVEIPALGKAGKAALIASILCLAMLRTRLRPRR